MSFLSREYSVVLRIDGQLNSSVNSAIRQATANLNGLGQRARQSVAQVSRQTENLQRELARASGIQNYRQLQNTIRQTVPELGRMRQNARQLQQEWESQERAVASYRQNLQRLRDVRAQTTDRTQYRILGEQIRVANVELRQHEQNLTQARTNYNRQNSEIDRATASLQRQQSQLRALNSALREAGVSADQFRQSESQLQSQTDRANAALQRSRNLDNARGRMNEASQNVSYAYGNFQGSIDTAKSIMSPITQSVEVYANFDATMSQVKAVTGVTGAAYDALKAKAEEMGAQTQFSASEAAGAMVKLGKTGWTDQQILGGIKPLLQTAIAGGADLATTADIVSDTMSAFGKVAGKEMTTSLGTQTEATQRFADVFAATASNANTDINLMGETFKYAAATAGSLGYSIEDVALATGVMGNNAVKGSMAGTALNSIMTRMAAPPKDAAATLEKLGVSAKNSDGSMKPLRQTLQELRGKFKNLTDSEKAEYAQNIADTEAMKGFLALMNESEENFDRLAGKIDNSAGATDKMAATMADNLEGSLKSFDSASEAVQISLGKVFEPATRGAVEFGIEAARGLNNFVTNNQTAVQVMGALAAAISAAVVGLAGFALANSGLTFLSSSFELLKLKATGAMTSVRAFWAAQTAGSSSSAAVNVIRNLGSAFASAGRAALGFVFSPVGAVLTALAVAGLYCYQNWEKVAPVFSRIAGIVTGSLGGSVSSLGTAFDALGNAVQRLLPALGNIGGVIFGALAVAVTAVAGLGATLITTISGAVSSVLSIFGGLGNSIASLLAGNWQGVWDGLVEAASSAVDGIKNLFVNLFGGLGDTVGNIFSTIKDLVGGEVKADVSTTATPQATAAPIDTSQAQQGVNQLGDASNSAANSTQSLAQNIETNSTGAQTLNTNLQTAGEGITNFANNVTGVGEGVNALQTNLTSTGEGFAQLTTNAQTTSTEFTNLQTNAQTTSTEFTNLTANAQQVSPALQQLQQSAASAAPPLQQVGSSASSASSGLSQISSAAGSVANALQAKASQISSISISAPKVAANAKGGIYKQGAFLTTFAEKSPEAAIPLDNSKRAKDLWTQAGQALGMIEGKKPAQQTPNTSVAEKIYSRRVEEVKAQAEKQKATSPPQPISKPIEIRGQRAEGRGQSLTADEKAELNRAALELSQGKIPTLKPPSETSSAEYKKRYENHQKLSQATKYLPQTSTVPQNKTSTTSKLGSIFSKPRPAAPKQNNLPTAPNFTPSLPRQNIFPGISNIGKDLSGNIFTGKIKLPELAQAKSDISNLPSLLDKIPATESKADNALTQPNISINITIQGNADQNTMRQAGQTLAVDLKKELDSWWREKNHDLQRKSFV